MAVSTLIHAGVIFPIRNVAAYGNAEGGYGGNATVGMLPFLPVFTTTATGWTLPPARNDGR